MNSYDEVKLEVVRTLNSTVLNNAFTKLYANDVEIAPEHDYTPNIWENKWYNDDVIPGYSKGYCVWKNVYCDLTSFLDDYGDIVYEYARANDMLKHVVDKRWKEVSALTSDAQKDVWKQTYMNVISGYSKQDRTSLTMNNKVRYIKLSFKSGVAASGITLSKLKFKSLADISKEFKYPSSVYFMTDGVSVKDADKTLQNLLDDKGITI